MKRIFLLVVFLMSMSVAVFSQNYNVINSQSLNKPFLDKKPVHWGFTFGTNKTDFSIYKNNSIYANDTLNGVIGIESTSYPGLFLGPIMNIRLGDQFDLRFLINISFLQRNFSFYEKIGGDSVTITKIKVPSSFIEVPLLLKYKGTRKGNFRPYIVAGGAVKYDMGTLKKTKTDEPYIKLSPIDFYLEVGPGIDFYLPYFKFSIELKYGNGFMNVLQKDNTKYDSTIDALKSHTFMISFHFES